MVSEGEIKVEVQEILDGADLTTTTSRKVRKEVAQRLHLTVEESDDIKSVIEREISTFLDAQNAEPLPCTPANTSSQPEKRKATASTPEAKPAKQAKTNSAGEVEFVLSENRKVLLRQFNGRQLIDVREFYEKDGKQQPGAKGLAMSPAQWRKLAEAMPQLTSAAEAEDEGFSLDLGNNRLASVKLYKGQVQVDLREHYEKDGDLAPGKKGISVTVEQWETLCSNAAQISELAEKGTPASPAAKKEGSAKKSVKKEVSGGGVQGDPEFVELGNKRRASISEFKGRKLLNLREYYEKDGQILPGKKGISLSKDQAEALLENADAFSEALADRTNLSVAVGTKRYAKVDKYKSTWNLDIREYYEKDGEEKPGTKGLSLPEDQWKILKSHLKQLVEQI